MIIKQNQWKTNLCRQNQYFHEHPYVHTSWAERHSSLVKKLPLWAAQKWLFYSAYFCDWGMKKDVFCGIYFCDVDVLWKKMRNLFLQSQCFNKIFSTKSTKEDKYIWE